MLGSVVNRAPPYWPSLLCCAPLLVLAIGLSAGDWLGSLLEGFFRSLLLGSLFSIIFVPFGFAAASVLNGMPRIPTSRLLAVCLLPAILGDASAAFVFRDIPAALPVFEARPLWLTCALLSFVGAWQYLPLFVCVFWLRLQFIPKSVLYFCATSRFSLRETVVHIYWTQCRDVATVLALFAFITGFQEGSRTAVLLHASPGTQTEFVNRVLDRMYEENIRIDSGIQDRLVMYGVMMLIPALATAGSQAFLLRKWGYQPLAWCVLLCGGIERRTVSHFVIAGVRWCILLALLVTCLSPVLYLLPNLASSQCDWLLFSKTLAFSLIAGVAILLFSLWISLLMRVRLPIVTAQLRGGALWILLAILSLKLLPNSALAHGAFLSLGWLGTMSPHLSLVLWLICQVVLGFPIITAFAFIHHFEVATSEIVFFRVHRGSTDELVDVSFFQRLKSPYLLIFVFAITLAWNEYLAPELFSGVPSVPYELAKRVSGKGTDLPQASALIMPVAIAAFAALLVWGRHISSRLGQQETHG